MQPPAHQALPRLPLGARQPPRWLGDLTAEEWLAHAHGESLLNCHTLKGPQCAGAAIYRRNVAKLPRPPALILPADREAVFSSRAEFTAHHSKTPTPTP